ncbi:hypothetical protein HK100_009384 [Physocladia obscura]|uniref:Uncharacterized protein n=1 Tax=Physocladia obscura TaxID=109957 RepID=A0AAD5XI08_9FUNG|nr:hypothetical protein HK100_009384 [Physocladia obscura]
MRKPPEGPGPKAIKKGMKKFNKTMPATSANIPLSNLRSKPDSQQQRRELWHPLPQIAPIVLHANLRSADIAAFEANISDESTDSDSKSNKHLLHLLLATYPQLIPPSPNSTAATNNVRRLNPMVVDDEYILADLAINLRRLVDQYPIPYSDASKRKLAAAIQPRGSNEYAEDEFVRITRLTPATLPRTVQVHNACRNTLKRIITYSHSHTQLSSTTPTLSKSGFVSLCPTHGIDETDRYMYDHEQSPSTPTTNSCAKVRTEIRPIAQISNSENEHTAHAHAGVYVVEWYVSFTDQIVFRFNDSARFASEEIRALENPVVGSLKEYLYVMSREDGQKLPPPLIANDIHFHLPKDKQKDDFRHAELDPLSRDYAGLPTPILIMGAPKLATINSLNFYGKINDAVENIDSALALMHSRVANNFICMSAPDRLANPLRPRVGAYTLFQIRQIFRTAYTAFRGAVLKAKETHECLKTAYSTDASDAHIGLALQPQQQVPTDTVLEVAVHTGDWGAGEFQNNKFVMAYLQIAAAVAAGVDFLYYHVLPSRGVEDVVTYQHVTEAKVLLKTVWDFENDQNIDNILLEDVFKVLEARGEEWVSGPLK